MMCSVHGGNGKCRATCQPVDTLVCLCQQLYSFPGKGWGVTPCGKACVRLRVLLWCNGILLVETKEVWQGVEDIRERDQYFFFGIFDSCGDIL